MQYSGILLEQNLEKISGISWDQNAAFLAQYLLHLNKKREIKEPWHTKFFLYWNSTVYYGIVAQSKIE